MAIAASTKKIARMVIIFFKKGLEFVKKDFEF